MIWVRRGLDLLERHWKALWKRVEEPAEPLTLSDSLKAVALLTLVIPLMCFPVYAGMSLLRTQEISDLRSSLGSALELVAVALILYVLGLLFGLLSGGRSRYKPHVLGSSLVPAGGSGVVGGGHVSQHRLWSMVRLGTAGLYAIEGTGVAFIGLKVWPVWASVAVGSGFLVLAYLVQPREGRPSELAPFQVSAGEANSGKPSRTRPGQSSRLYSEAAPAPEVWPGSGSGSRPHLSPWMRDVLFLALFHVGLFAKVGIIVALAGGPPWALLGGVVGPPLIFVGIAFTR
jgi:hypothetical protein